MIESGTGKLTSDGTGPIVRYGPNCVSINTHSAMRDIYAASSNLIKSDFYTVANWFFGSSNSLTVRDRAEAARKRRILLQALSAGAIKSVEEHILKNIRLFCESLGPNSHDPPISSKNETERDQDGEGDWSPARDIAAFANRLTFDVMGDVCFSRNFQMLTKEDHRWFLSFLPNAIQGLNVVGHLKQRMSLAFKS